MPKFDITPVDFRQRNVNACDFFSRLLNTEQTYRSSGLCLEVLKIILGTKATRLGPIADDAQQARMLPIVEHYMNLGQPIPFVCPWGSEKPDGSGIDVAELMAIWTLTTLNQKVKLFYPPGLQFNIRIENVSAPHLFFHRPDRARDEAARYTDSFIALTNVLGVSDVVRPWPESKFCSEKTFNNEADTYLTLFKSCIRKVFMSEDVSREHKLMWDMGWKGEIHREEVIHYLNCYRQLYSELDQGDHLEMAARYYAACLARVRLGLVGIDKAWTGDHLQIYFNAPVVRGSDSTRYNRVHYRTMPTQFTTNHVAPWRGFGYLLVDEAGAYTPKLRSPAEERTLVPNVMRLVGNGGQVDVRADLFYC